MIKNIIKYKRYMELPCCDTLFCCFNIQLTSCCFHTTTINQKNPIHKKYLPPIQWNETIPFIPPIEQGQVIKVYDGDTITIAAKMPYEDSPLYRFPVRFLGIDSPEIKGKTEEEKKAAKASQQALESLILQKIVYLKNIGNEKYGRILADVYVDDPKNPEKQIHLNIWMVENGFAVNYDGKAKPIFGATLPKSEL
jgi:endonuclease YncB( thermonuclease family)